MYKIPLLPLQYKFDSVEILKQLNRTSRQLALLNGIVHTIPNEHLLISSLTLQEAHSSSAVENIVTTHDDLYKHDLGEGKMYFSPATKEVYNYREAITKGYEIFINDPEISDLDPLIKMAIIHHQFESIHPFGDGNGRTGRIINILYLVISGLLDVPVLYFSRYITANKNSYYSLIQSIRNSDAATNEQCWNNWILFMLKGIEQTAATTVNIVKGISCLMAKYKPLLRNEFGKSYKHEMINNLFTHPYTKIKYLSQDMNIDRRTASDYLERIVSLKLLYKEKIGRENYYINTELLDLFLSVGEEK